MDELVTVDSAVTDFGRSVAGVLQQVWGDATGAEAGDVAEVWRLAADHGWFELASAGAFDAAIMVERQLGRVGCPLPVSDGYLAGRLLGYREIETAAMRVVVAADPTAPIDAGGAATHVLVIPRGGGTARLHPIVDQHVLPGLAVPSWTRALLGDPVTGVEISAAAAGRMLTQARLGRAVRASAAAARAHELAVEHAKVRTQFGKVIGGFGAIQQRVAQCQIDVRSADLMIDDAVRSLAAQRHDAILTAELAIAQAVSVAPRVQLAAHHTLAAIGYFNEHPAPWLFRRVHADIVTLGTLEPEHGSVGDILVESGAALPGSEVGEVGEDFRIEVDRFIDDLGVAGAALKPVDVDPVAVRGLAERGWLGFEWPAEYGGRSAGLAEQLVLNEQITYRRVGATKALGAVMLIGSAILRHGTEQQKRQFLPTIAAGDLNFCLGYSEPGAGSDLASLRTRADRDGESWVINGQKLWTTGAHVSDWVWLAARTDPDAKPRHAGITVFLFRLDTPGITIQRHTALSGEDSCTVFYDDVRIPDTARIGEINGGWAVIVDALAGERITMANIAAALHRQLDDMVAFAASDPIGSVGERGSSARAAITELAARVQATRALVGAAIKASATDLGAMFDAAMAGVLAGEVAEEFGEAALRIFGPAAALSGDGTDTSIPGGGAFEYGLRQSIMYVVGGGTNDVQRGLIARGLGLPR